MDDPQQVTSNPSPIPQDQTSTIPDTSTVDVNFNRPNFHPYFKKLFVPFLAVLTLVAGLGVSLNLVRQRQDTRTQASVSNVDLTLSAPATIGPNQEVAVTVGINTQDYKVTAVQLELTYPTDKYDYVSLVPSDFLATVLTPAANAGGAASVVVGSGTTPKQGVGTLAVLTLRSKASASGATQITSGGGTAVAGIDSTGAAVPSSILGDASPVTITIESENADPDPSATPEGSEATPAITRGGLSIDYAPWVVWVEGTDFSSSLKAKIMDNSQQWGDLRSVAIDAEKTGISFSIPSNLPPSQCNKTATCTIQVQLVTPLDQTSNAITITLPITDESITTATPSPSPTAIPGGSSSNGQPNGCGGTCGSHSNCKAGLFCSNGLCRNPSCSTDSDCVCNTTATTPTPTPKPTPKASPVSGIVPTPPTQTIPPATSNPTALLTKPNVPTDLNFTYVSPTPLPKTGFLNSIFGYFSGLLKALFGKR